MRLHTAAVVLGLLNSPSSGKATPSGDISVSTGFQQQHLYRQPDVEQRHQHPMRNEPPAWTVAYGNDEVGRRLNQCIPGTSPYNSTTIISDIGAGSANGCSTGGGGGGRYLQGQGGSDGRYLQGGGKPQCDKCSFLQCSGDSVDDNRAYDPVITSNLDGTYSYSFSVTGAKPAISHVTVAFEEGCCLESFIRNPNDAGGTDAADTNVACDPTTCVTGVKDNQEHSDNEVRQYKLTFSNVTNPIGGKIAVVLKAGNCKADGNPNCVTYIDGPSCTGGSPMPGPDPIPDPDPSDVPSDTPSENPSSSPSSEPSSFPSSSLSSRPSEKPSTSSEPSKIPSSSPSSRPSEKPSTSSEPSKIPSSSLSSRPSEKPSTSSEPSKIPSSSPSSRPSEKPSTSSEPSKIPSSSPSSRPSEKPSTSSEPSKIPSSSPSSRPSEKPSTSSEPSKIPSQDLTKMPSSATPAPTRSMLPSGAPSTGPSEIPSSGPSAELSRAPSSGPSRLPSNGPSSSPSGIPSSVIEPEPDPSDPASDPTCSIDVDMEGCILSSSDPEVCSDGNDGVTPCECDGKCRQITFRLLKNVGGNLTVNAGCGTFTFDSPNNAGKMIDITCDLGEKFDAQMYFCNSTDQPEDCDESTAMQSETLHTSCSVPIVVGLPAPLNVPKGDPSSLFFVESFVETEGRVVNPIDASDEPGDCPGILSIPSADEPDPIISGSGTSSMSRSARGSMKSGGRSGNRGRMKSGGKKGSDSNRRLRLRNPRRADEIGNDKKDGGSSRGGMSKSKSKGSNSMDPIDDITGTATYKCQYNVTNLGSVNVTAMVDSPSIDLGTIQPSASDIFLLDYNGTAGVCPNVTVSATEGECTDSDSWSSPSDDVARRNVMRDSTNKKKIIRIFPNDANSWDV